MKQKWLTEEQIVGKARVVSVTVFVANMVSANEHMTKIRSLET